MEETKFRILVPRRTLEKCAVSVVIPVYNVENYLRECLDSVLKQSLTEIEIICVDDGSKDGSLNILLEYAQKDGRIVVITQNNSGLSATRNCGVNQATGEYLYFLDSDDTIETDALQTLYSLAKQNNLEVICCDGTSFSEQESCAEEAEKYKDYYNRKYSYPAVTSGSQLMYQMQKNNEYRVQCSLQLVQTEYFRKNKLWFENGILHEDNLYTYRCMLDADRAGYVHRSFFNRRLRQDSIMTKKKSFKNAYGYFITHMKMIDFLKTKQLPVEEQEAALEILYRVLQSGRYCFSELDESERKKADQLLPEEKWLFQAYIGEYVKVKENLERKCHAEYEAKENAKKQLEQMCLEKTELNGRLQKAFLEKDELKRRLQRAQQNGKELNERLQKAFRDKAELKSKLQIAYQDKEERGLQIKCLTEEISRNNKTLEEKNKKIKSQTEEIKQLRKNPAVRLERKLRSLKRKSVDIIKPKEKGKVWLIGTPEYGNLGDHQISESELAFLNDVFPDRELKEITMDVFDQQKEELRKAIKKEDLLFFHGGGNIGNLWPRSENIRREAFRIWRDNIKIVLPQSICFTEDEAGKRELEISQETYSDAKDILVCREEVSWKFAKENFKCQVLLTPDMVMYSKPSELFGKYERKGVLLCFRADKERLLTDDEKEQIEKYLEEKFCRITKCDTVLPKSIKVEERQNELNKFFEQLARSELVVTDRLHGMVFCALTGTPCIVFPNSYHKVESCAVWLNNLGYIKVVHQVSELPDALRKVLDNVNWGYDMQDKFQELKKVLRDL